MKNSLIAAMLAIKLIGCDRAKLAIPSNFAAADITVGPITLDPRLASDAMSERICELIYSSLLRIDDRGDWAGDLASSFERPTPLLAEGIADFAENDAIQLDLIPWLAERHDLMIERSPGTTYQYIIFNFRDPRLRDINVRRAIAYGIDRATIVRAMLKDAAQIATGLLTPRNWAYNGNVIRCSYDPLRARARKGGRLRKLTPKDLKTVRALLRSSDVPVSTIAEQFRIARSTLYRNVAVLSGY